MLREVGALVTVLATAIFASAGSGPSLVAPGKSGIDPGGTLIKITDPARGLDQKKISDEDIGFHNENSIVERNGERCKLTISCKLAGGYCIKKRYNKCKGTVDPDGCKGGRKCKCCIPGLRSVMAGTLHDRAMVLLLAAAAMAGLTHAAPWNSQKTGSWPVLELQQHQTPLTALFQTSKGNSLIGPLFRHDELDEASPDGEETTPAPSTCTCPVVTPCPTCAVPTTDNPTTAESTTTDIPSTIAVTTKDCDKEITVYDGLEFNWTSPGYDGVTHYSNTNYTCTLEVTIPTNYSFLAAGMEMIAPSVIFNSTDCAGDNLKRISSTGTVTRFCGNLSGEFYFETQWSNKPKTISFTWTSVTDDGTDVGFKLKLTGQTWI